MIGYKYSNYNYNSLVQNNYEAYIYHDAASLVNKYYNNKTLTLLVTGKHLQQDQRSNYEYYFVVSYLTHSRAKSFPFGALYQKCGYIVFVVISLLI